MKRRRKPKQLALTLPLPPDEATLVALDIRRWTDSPNPARWRVERLAEALRRG